MYLSPKLGNNTVTISLFFSVMIITFFCLYSNGNIIFIVIFNSNEYNRYFYRYFHLLLSL